MPVAALYVEGRLDQRLLIAVLGGAPAVEVIAGGKRALPPAARHRGPIGGAAAYIRDRDFDSDPPQDRSRPSEQRREGDAVLGWAWCRHEIENYLLEPGLVRAALDCSPADYATALTAAATTLLAYASCRWAVGKTRARLPPTHELETRPTEVVDHDFRLPQDLSADGTLKWLLDHTSAFRARVCPALEQPAVEQSMRDHRARLEQSLQQPSEILAWFPGKDLMAALEAWLTPRGLQPHTLRDRMERWVRTHPGETLDILGEWRQLVAVLRG